MKLLLHTCCGPCLIYPVQFLRHGCDYDYDITSFFYNPNIHPYKEFKRRLEAVYTFCDDAAIPLIAHRDYGLKGYLRKVVFNEEERCPLCYEMRLDHAAAYAGANGYPFFSTTLLYSRYQNHENIKKLCYRLADRYGIGFVYHDFRTGWQQGIDASIAKGLYRQAYCGCIYSEQERYDNRLKKRLRSNTTNSSQR